MPIKVWDTGRRIKLAKKDAAARVVNGKTVSADRIIELLECVINPGDRVAIEGNNQKQAEFLAKNLVKVDPQKVNGLHLVMSATQLPEHLDLFEKGIAQQLDFAYAGNSDRRMYEMISAGTIKVGAIHTYLELFSRYFTDLTPNVALCVGQYADRQGNIYTGNNTEETPLIIEAAAFKDGVVVVQVDEIRDSIPRVDIPADWVDYIVESDIPCMVEPMFTKDPTVIKDEHVLMGMMAIKGVYGHHLVNRLNHGIGFATAAIELLLPTYGEELGLRGKICEYWASNPVQALIPAIESGWVKQIHSFGSDVGMEDYVSARPDIFFLGQDGSMRSNRCYSQMAGLYGIDMFNGSTLQMDAFGNSSTVTKGRITGFGGAPNMGGNPPGRRHVSPAWVSMNNRPHDILSRGRKLVVQMLRTKSSKGVPFFVPELDAIEVSKKAGFEEPAIMIHGEDVTHLITEVGLSRVYMAEDINERKKLIAAVAGDTAVGQTITRTEIETLRKANKVVYPEDLGIDPGNATRARLSAKTFDDIIDWSGGLYKIPAKFLR